MSNAFMLAIVLLLSISLNATDTYALLELDKKLIQKVREGEFENVVELLERGASLEARDVRGWTPLHFAAWFSSDIIPTLLERMANINAENNNKSTPLHVAAQYGEAKVIEWLLAHGAEKDCINSSGCTPFHYACISGKIENVRALLSAGVDVYKVNDKGFTSLGWAKKSGYKEIVSLLREHQSLLEDAQHRTLFEGEGSQERSLR